jgi:hypothetical protein
MLRSERRERLEALATSDSPISHSQYWLNASSALRQRAIAPPWPNRDRRFDDLREYLGVNASLAL